MTRRLALAALAAAALSGALPAGAAAGISLESVEPAGFSAGAHSGASSGREIALSAGGRFLAFSSEANTLVGGDGNGTVDVFVRDRARRTTERVSVSSLGAEGRGASSAPAISAGGRYVAFASTASNLVPGGVRGRSDVYVHDRRTGATTRVSQRMAGFRGPRVLAYAPALSAGGRYVAYAAVRQVVHGDELDHAPLGVLVLDRRTGSTRRVSARCETGRGGPAVSADGRYVAFSARDARPGPALGTLPEAHVAGAMRHGRAAALRLRRADTTRGGSAPGARRGPAALMGHRAAGARRGPYRIFVRDLRTGRTTLASPGLEGDATAPSLSADGRMVAFQLSPRDGPIGDLRGPVGDVHVRDLARGTTSLASALHGGAPSGRSGFPALSGSGRAVAFVSAAALLDGDGNVAMDVYVRR